MKELRDIDLGAPSMWALYITLVIVIIVLTIGVLLGIHKGIYFLSWCFLSAPFSIYTWLLIPTIFGIIYFYEHIPEYIKTSILLVIFLIYYAIFIVFSVLILMLSLLYLFCPIERPETIFSKRNNLYSL